jgi:hypothetical protein
VARHCAARSSTSRLGSPGHNDAQCCTYQRTGPGPTGGWQSGTACSVRAKGHHSPPDTSTAAQARPRNRTWKRWADQRSSHTPGRPRPAADGSGPAGPAAPRIEDKDTHKDAPVDASGPGDRRPRASASRVVTLASCSPGWRRRPPKWWSCQTDSASTGRSRGVPRGFPRSTCTAVPAAGSPTVGTSPSSTRPGSVSSALTSGAAAAPCPWRTTRRTISTATPPRRSSTIWSSSVSTSASKPGC